MPPAKESSALLRTPVSLVAVTDKPTADLMGLHKEVRLEPTISFNSKWFVCNGTQQMHSACPATLNVIGYANKCKHLGIL